MDTQGIEAVLNRAEDSVASGDGIAGTGFRKLVSEAKRDPELARRHGERIAAIDEAAFRRWAMIVVPIVPGTILASIAAIGGVGLIVWARRLVGDGNDTAALVVFLAAIVMLLASTHGLGHLVVGRLAGIRFSAWFVARISKPQPGVKIDYQTYLLSMPIRRAWTHAAGALATKLVAIGLAAAAAWAGMPNWFRWALVAVAVVTVIADLVWSTKHSDWVRFRRELAYKPS